MAVASIIRMELSRTLAKIVMDLCIQRRYTMPISPSDISHTFPACVASFSDEGAIHPIIHTHGDQEYISLADFPQVLHSNSNSMASESRLEGFPSQLGSFTCIVA